MEQKKISDLESAIDDLVTLCSSEIVRYSMQNFMKWFTKEERFKLARWIAMRSYTQAHNQIMDYFRDLK